MAPAIKELSRWLDANSEYCVAPDWAEVVKHSVSALKCHRPFYNSKAKCKTDCLKIALKVLVTDVLPTYCSQGFLPEGKFTRILTEPISRDPGPRRRGRRPRSEMVKAGPILPESPSNMGPLFMNGGLIGSMDLVSLQNLRNVPGIPLTGLMGFPHGFAAVPAGAGEDAKNGIGMLPMMLHGMAAVQPPMFSVSGLMSQPSSSSPSSSSPTPTQCTSAGPTTVTSTSAAPSPASGSSPATSGPSPVAESCNSATPSGLEKRKEDRAPVEGRPTGPPGVHATATVSSTTPTSVSAGSISSTGSHLTFNPFLIPGMSHGLLYPHMFLPHGGIMALPGMPAADSSGSPKRKRKKVREDGALESGSTGSPPMDSMPARGPSDASQIRVDADSDAPIEGGPQKQETDTNRRGQEDHSEALPPAVPTESGSSIEEERQTEEKEEQDAEVKDERLPETERQEDGPREDLQ